MKPATQYSLNWQYICGVFEQVRLCMSSLALQRWLTMWIVFILFWAAMFLVQLSSTEASIVDIVQFVLFIVVVPLLCSAYGEVNYESKRMIRRICPTPWRVAMLFYMDQMPPQMQVTTPLPPLIFFLQHPLPSSSSLSPPFRRMVLLFHTE